MAKRDVPVAIKIDDSGSVEIEWEPGVENSTQCCAENERALIQDLKNLGIDTEKEGIFCKLQEVPEKCSLEEDKEKSDG